MNSIALFVAFSSIGWQARAGAEAPRPSVEEIVRGLERAESAIRSFEVDSEFSVRMEAPRAPDGYVRLTSRLHALVDRSGRFRFSETGTSFNVNTTGPTYPWRVVGTYDGKTLRQMAGSGEYSQGLISAKAIDAGWRFDPRRALFTFVGKSVAGWLREQNGRVVGVETVSGVPGVAVETEPVVRDGIAWKERFVVAPGKNFAVLRRALLKRYVESERWLEYSHVITSDYTEQAGAWLPGRVLYESFIIRKDAALAGAKDFPITWRYEGTLTHWHVNKAVADAEFHLEFEPGLFVNDRITGKSYPYEAAKEGGGF